jgi:hypothetical protein
MLPARRPSRRLRPCRRQTGPLGQTERGEPRSRKFKCQHCISKCKNLFFLHFLVLILHFDFSSAGRDYTRSIAFFPGVNQGKTFADSWENLSKATPDSRFKPQNSRPKTQDPRPRTQDPGHKIRRLSSRRICSESLSMVSGSLAKDAQGHYKPWPRQASLSVPAKGGDDQGWRCRPVASFSQRSNSALRCSANPGLSARRLAVSPMSVCRSNSCQSLVVLYRSRRSL